MQKGRLSADIFYSPIDQNICIWFMHPPISAQSKMTTIVHTEKAASVGFMCKAWRWNICEQYCINNFRIYLGILFKLSIFYLRILHLFNYLWWNDVTQPSTLARGLTIPFIMVSEAFHWKFSAFVYVSLSSLNTRATVVVLLSVTI